MRYGSSSIRQLQANRNADKVNIANINVDL